MKTMDKIQNTILDRAGIETILVEEEQFFFNRHYRLPIGREIEDVVDNAYQEPRDGNDFMMLFLFHLRITPESASAGGCWTRQDINWI